MPSRSQAENEKNHEDIIQGLQKEMDAENGYDAVKERKLVEAKTKFYVENRENTDQVFKRAEMREVDEEFNNICLDRIR